MRSFTPWGARPVAKIPGKAEKNEDTARIFEGGGGRRGGGVRSGARGRDRGGGPVPAWRRAFHRRLACALGRTACGRASVRAAIAPPAAGRRLVRHRRAPETDGRGRRAAAGAVVGRRRIRRRADGGRGASALARAERQPVRGREK